MAAVSALIGVGGPSRLFAGARDTGVGGEIPRGQGSLREGYDK